MNDMKDILVGNPKEKDCPKVNNLYSRQIDHLLS